jgi:hypothetical protein
LVAEQTGEVAPSDQFSAYERNMPRHVRVVMSWIGEIVKGQLD